MRTGTRSMPAGTPPSTPRQGATRLLRFATTLTGDPVPPATSELAMAASRLAAISGPL